MRIIAFDSECSRDFGLYCEMCMFDYAVCNDKFNIEVSSQLYIHASKPTGRSKKYMRSDVNKISDAPPYKKVRPHIAGIFSQEDAVFIAHSPETTFRYLCCMDRMDNLPGIRCKAYDIFTIVRNYADLPSYGLKDIAKTFGLPYDKNESSLDSKTCIRILQYICKEEKSSVETILEMCGKGALVDSEVIYHNTLLKFKKKRLDGYYERKPKDGVFKDKVFTIAESFENNRIETGFHIAEFITHHGGTLTRKASECNYLVWDGNIESKRLESVNRLPDGSVTVITVDELFSLDKVVEPEQPQDQ